MCLSNVVKNVVNWALTAPNPLSPSTSSVDGLHRREEEDVADGVGVGQQHHQAIHAEAEAARGGARWPCQAISGRFLLCRNGFRDSAMVLDALCPAFPQLPQKMKSIKQ